MGMSISQIESGHLRLFKSEIIKSHLLHFSVLLFLTGCYFYNNKIWLPIVDIIVTLSCCGLLLSFKNQDSFLRRIFNSLILNQLGKISYSLYLSHCLFLAIWTQLIVNLNLSMSQQLLAMFGVGLPTTVGACYLVYLAFEKPFLRNNSERSSEEPLDQLHKTDHSKASAAS